MAAVWSLSICGETVRYESVCLFCPKVVTSAFRSGVRLYAQRQTRLDSIAAGAIKGPAI